MSVTSANPDLLDEFVRVTPGSRQAAGHSAAAGRALAAAVQSRCLNRGLSATNFATVQQLLENFAADERFVHAIADALRTADVHNGIRSMDDTAIASRFAPGGYGSETAAVTIASVALLGEPANSGLVDDPICAANGNFIHRDLDLVFAGTSASLNVHRFYNSLAADRVGVFGAGWTSAFDVRLSGVGEQVIVSHLADGAELAFVASGDGWTTRDRRNYRLEHDAAGGWTLLHGVGAVRAWCFDAQGRLRGWRVAASHVTVDRDRQDRITAVHESRSGRTIRLAWSDGKVESIAACDGRQVTYRYAAADTLARVESAAGWFDYTYAGRLMLTATDPDGVSQFVNVYGADGRVEQQTSPFGRVTSYRYDIPGSTVVTDERGARQAMVHDPRGNLTAVIDADGSAMRITYDDRDRAVRVVSRSGAVWLHDFDPVTGLLIRRTDPDGLSQTWEYDQHHRPTSTVDRAGAAVRFEYQGEHTTPTTVIDPDGARTHADLNVWGQPTSVTDADGVTTHFEWDGDGQLVRIVDALGRAVDFEFDAVGLLRRLSDVAGGTTEFGYDGTGRLAATHRAGTASSAAAAMARSRYGYTTAGRPNRGDEFDSGEWWAEFGSHGAVVAVSDALGATIRYDYDTHGNIVSVTAPDGAVYRQTFDDVGRLVGVVAPSGAASRQTHDLDGRVVEFTDPAGRRHTRTLDGLGRTIESVAPDGAVTTWAYHPGGEVAELTVVDPDRRRSTWRTEVDICGRVVSIIAPEGAVERLAYSPAGRLVRRIDDHGSSVDYRYDAGGRPVRVASRARRPPTGADAYDRRGLLVGATDPAGLTTSYEYDVRGRLVSQRAPGERITRWTYDADGWLSTVADPAGVLTRLVRDPSGVVTAVERGDAGWAATLDANGRQIERRGHDRAPISQFTYDVAGRLRQAMSASGRATDFDWDRLRCATAGLERACGHSSRACVDDVLLADDASTVYRLDAAERLVEIVPPAGEPTRFEYGDDGLIAVEFGPGGTRRFGYDAAGRVATITVDGVGTTQIGYDAAGRRASEVTPDGARTDYGWNAVDQLVTIEQTGADGNHHRVEIDVDAFGRPHRINDAAVVPDRRFARIGSLTVMGSRVYDPATHQFLTADLLMTVPGTNGAASAYTYAWQNPAAFVDPSGLRPISIEEFESIRTREERGSLGQAWEAVKADPWGTALMIGVGVAAFAIGGPAGLGIAIGMTMSAGVGLATGTFNPRTVAVNGVIGGLSAGAASAGTGAGLTLGRTMLNGAVLGGGGDVMNQIAAGRGLGDIDWYHAVGSAELGAATAGVGARFESVTTTAVRSASLGGATDIAADVTLQMITGSNPLTWNTVVNGVASVGSNGFTHYVTPVHVDYDVSPSTHSLTVDVATETYYRTISPTHLAQLQTTGRIPASGETFITDSLEYARGYRGHTVEFQVEPGTFESLTSIGVRDTSTELANRFPEMPIVSKGWGATSAYFKYESGPTNIGLGNGAALDTFNDNIMDFAEIPE
jgi:RHS repeat-associated protein